MSKKETYWWEDSNNKESLNFPISIIQADDIWVASLNSDSKKILGNYINGVSQGESREEAIDNLFDIVRFQIEYLKDCSLKYARWVPFRKGDWSRTGGTWFVVFGVHFYFRKGKGMKGGWYVPFTELNIMVNNEWKEYKKFKNENKTT